ncbi:MAG: glycerol-3-phosphate dehydrogenase/oxidase, partial [Kangiellaceae bacterium]|nr:glycerol-3-phosphate dehydrogenase/oxidase [Kangiellaceae bacterium]
MQPNLADNLKLTRQQRLALLKENKCWDLIVIGGGICGAGIFKLASQLGLKVLLLEQNDFAWGSSSRSSKMVHGGLRYVVEGQIGLTMESVKERQRLLKDAQHLVIQESFIVSHYRNKFPWRWAVNFLLYVYGLLAGRKLHHSWKADEYSYLAPGSQQENSTGGSQFFDAMTDDSRLVLRLLQEGQQLGGLAVNYLRVAELIQQRERVVGVKAEAEGSKHSISISASMVVNATGAWSNQLLPSKKLELRPLRGSHLVVPGWRLPVASAVAVMHPKDKRPVQIFPWQNTTVIGTTDVEHEQPLSNEPAISQSELEYLLECVDHQFPQAKLTEEDIISTFAGVRPVISKGTKVAPSKESRSHSILKQPGLVTVAGGKLTTFRLIASEVLQNVCNDKHFEKSHDGLKLKLAEFENHPIFEPYKDLLDAELDMHVAAHILGCYGDLAKNFLIAVDPKDLSPISYTKNLWAELHWAAKYEQVFHLDDLLLRRT